MLTADDLHAIPLFSSLSETDLERLARTAADVYLGPGEFAVHEGGEGALYAVVAGKIEVLKLIDGVERTSVGAILALSLAKYHLLLGPRFPVPIVRPNHHASCASTLSNITRWQPALRTFP